MGFRTDISDVASVFLEPAIPWPGLAHDATGSDAGYAQCHFDTRMCPVQFRSKRTCQSNIELYEKMFRTKFDWVFFARPDLVWKYPIGDLRVFKRAVFFLGSEFEFNK